MLKSLVIIEIDRKDVENGNVAPTLKLLNGFKATPKIAKAHMEKLDICFAGFDDDSRSLWEIPEVRDFVFKLNKEFKHWLFFLRKDMLGLMGVTYCLLNPKLIVNGWMIEKADIEKLLKDEWWAGFNEMSNFTGLFKNEKREEEIGLLGAEYLFLYSFLARKKSILEM